MRQGVVVYAYRGVDAVLGDGGVAAGLQVHSVDLLDVGIGHQHKIANSSYI